MADARRRRRFSWLGPGLAILAALGLWELLARTGVLTETGFPPMVDAMAELGSQLVKGSFWVTVGETMQGWVLGLGIAAVAGITLGIVIGSHWALTASLRAVIEFLRPVPSVALIPLAILLFGTDLQSKVFLAAFASFWPILIQTLYGMQDLDPVAIDTARAFGLGRLERMWRMTLPNALPYIATGVRISSAVALILVVTAELVIGAPGLGREISVASSNGVLPLMYGLIVATGILGWLLNTAMKRVEARVMHWHPSQRAEGGL